MNIREAIAQIRSQCPGLSDTVVVERYPERPDPFYGRLQSPGAVFCYQFMSLAGLNVATYIPDLAEFGGLVFQTGFDGHGRSYPEHLIRETISIEALPCPPTNEDRSHDARTPCP